MSKMKSFIAYLRVSTDKQAESGLGLEAQRATVQAYLASQGASDTDCTWFVEAESGRNNERPELQKALRLARIKKSRLVIAKLDRLARNAHFLTGIMESGVDLYCCDLPNADRLVFTVMAGVAEWEARAISERTRKALQAAKERGVRLGNPNGAAALRRASKGNSAAVSRLKANATARAANYREVFEDLKAEGISSANGLAVAMNQRGFESPRGGKWTAKSVIRTMSRLEVAA